jgi:flagellar capping protein FliD
MAISIGGLGDNGGRLRVNGLVSGLNGEEIIQEAAKAKLAALKRQEDKVTLNDGKIEALTKLKGYFVDLRAAADKLRSPPGYSFDQENNMFAAKKIFLSSALVSNPNNYVDITATSAVERQNFDIKVSSIAKNQIQKIGSFADKTSSVTKDSRAVGEFKSGTLQINGTDVTLVEGDSLSNIASKINSVKSVTRVSATIIQPSIGSYSIQLMSLDSGISNAYAITDASDVLKKVTISNVQTATDAVIEIDNISVSRPTNDIDDYLDGLVIKVFNPTSDPITVDVDYDKNSALTTIAGFVEKYNEVVSFINEQQARNAEGQFLESAKIQRNTFVSNTKLSMVQLLSSLVADNNSFEDLNSVGIEFPPSEKVLSDPTSASTLSVDANKLASTIFNNFEEIRKLMEFQYESSSSNFRITQRSNNIAENTTFSITVDVSLPEADRAQITYGATTVNATFQPNDVGDLTKGGFVIGDAGTPFEGFEFQYTGLGAKETTNIVASQGVMDKMYNFLDEILSKTYTSLTGEDNAYDAFDLEIATINEGSLALKNEIDLRKARIEKETERKIEKMSQVEAQIAKANSLLQLLQTQMDVMTKKG